jgi:hypothetical protein
MSDVNVGPARSAFALVARPSYFCSFQSCLITSAWTVSSHHCMG